MKEFEINNRINQLIEKLNITPYEFSKKIGNKRPDGLYRILKNEVKPTPKTLEKIKEVFPEYYIWLLTGEGSMLKESTNVISGDITTTNGNTKVSTSSEANCISEKKELLKRLEVAQEQLSETQKQVSKLIEQQERLLSKLNN